MSGIKLEKQILNCLENNKVIVIESLNKILIPPSSISFVRTRFDGITIHFNNGETLDVTQRKEDLNLPDLDYVI